MKTEIEAFEEALDSSPLLEGRELLDALMVLNGFNDDDIREVWAGEWEEEGAAAAIVYQGVLFHFELKTKRFTVDNVLVIPDRKKSADIWREWRRVHE